MNISKKQVDALNIVLSVTIKKEDYNESVEKALKDYRKTANIPGFRKGHVPEAMVRKQYGRAVQYDEVNKLLDRSLYDYLNTEKLEFLGNPLPVTKEVDWDADEHTFDFELGLTPTFEVDLKPKKGVRYFEVKVDESLIDTQIERITKQFGSVATVEEIATDSEISGVFFNEEKNIDKEATFSVDALSKKASKKFIGKKVGDQLTLDTKDLFNDAHDLMHQLGVSHEESHHLDVKVTFTVEQISQRIPAELNQELFDKLFPANEVTTEEQLRAKIRENAQMQYQGQAEQQFLNDMTDYLLDTTTFELPATFLKKWLQVSGEKPLTEQEANAEYEKSERGIRYQLIEAKLLKDNNLQITREEFINFAKGYISNQMLQFGMTPEDAQVDEIVGRILKNREETERLNQQLLSKKLIEFYKENVTLDKKEVSYDEFIEEVYKKEDN